MPRDVYRAYESKTRSFDGAPGPDYWQNHVSYDLNVRVNPLLKQLSGTGEITYQNNSPDSLRLIVLQLYQDRYRMGNMRDFPVDSGDVHGGTRLHALKIDGEELDLDDEQKFHRRYGTVLTVNLEQPLYPGEKMQIDLTWEVRLPSESSRKRMGVDGDSAMFIAYWYPEVAVYDDVDGWDRFSHTGDQEFYHEFSDYKVNITFPSEFVVWATGELQNGKFILQPEIYERFQRAFTTDSVLHIITPDDYINGPVTQGKVENTWIFTAENVPDFAFAASRTHLWDGASLVVDAVTERRVMIDAVYRKNSQDFYEVAEIGRNFIRYLSEVLPGVPFPYPRMTVFNSSIGGGMEFPMMVNNGTTKTRRRTISLTAHEIAHTYFPFYMGINEKKYGWMDEGWAVMLPVDFDAKMAGNDHPMRRRINSYALNAGNEMEMPMMIPNILLDGPTLRMAIYDRPGIAYLLLQNLMGVDQFREALHLYIERWHGKHPLPYDFFYTFNARYGESLNWFWKPWFFERGYPDLAIEKVETDGNRTRVIINKIGILPIPLKLTISYENGSQLIIDKPISIWASGQDRYEIEFEHDLEITRIYVGDALIPDSNPGNNEYEND